MTSVLDPILLDAPVHALSLTSSRCSSLSSWPWTGEREEFGDFGSPFLEMELRPATKLDAVS